MSNTQDKMLKGHIKEYIINVFARSEAEALNLAGRQIYGDIKEA